MKLKACLHWLSRPQIKLNSVTLPGGIQRDLTALSAGKYGNDLTVRCICLLYTLKILFRKYPIFCHSFAIMDAFKLC